MLFQKKSSAPLSLPQSEREAIVDLLHLCLYADSHISLKEGQFIADVVDVIGWDANLSFPVYESRSIAAARVARGGGKEKQDFLSFAAERLQSPEGRLLAVELCRDLAAADGTVQREATVIGEIVKALDAR
ncbi:hypothetical protein [Actomonas aquatica]|uniref:Co-chaperone DjlA N-terminal domain-containing protein n=1 Tax=Actomonas aquatica TaxID=2866162 RepID=A0ABZ1CB84_9BACT|nr:hypothetical protein [Opitutus sp. WL0086]WRQ87834.1 hypothetical protein K1X11_000330 [Opitutus sp. WL0086]